MKFFKKPLVAFLLCLLVVWCSTGLSVRMKLDSKVDKLNDILYEGITLNGVYHPDFASPLRALCNLTDDIVLIAQNYGIDTEELLETVDYLQSALLYSDDDVGYIGDCYYDYIYALNSVLMQLEGTGLSLRHTELMDSYLEQINSATGNIELGAAGYNAAVEKFQRSHSGFPQSIADAFGYWNYPYYFDKNY